MQDYITPLYRCDPERAAACGKSRCYKIPNACENPCRHTTRREWAKTDEAGHPIKADPTEGGDET